MAHLTQHHPFFGIIDKVVSDISTVRIMAGDTTQIPAGRGLGRILFTAERMPLTAHGPDDMGLVAEMTMAGQAQLIDRFDQLRFVGAAVGIVTGLAHSGLDRAVDKLLFLDLQRHVGMTLVTEFGPTLGDAMLGAALAVVAVTAGIGTGRAVHIFDRHDFLVADVTGVFSLDAAVHLGRGRVHDVAGLTEALAFGLVHHNRRIFRRHALSTSLSEKDIQIGRLDLLSPLEKIDDNPVDARIPKRLGDEKILEQLAVLRRTDVDRITGYAI